MYRSEKNPDYLLEVWGWEDTIVPTICNHYRRHWGMQAVRQYRFFETSYLVIYLVTAKGTREKEWVVLCPTDGVALTSVYLIGGQPIWERRF